MSSSLTIDGKEYIPAISAGKRFGYTKDYILLLIKEGKIEGQKIGNKWYVHPTSAEDHFEVAKKHREFQRNQISLERKAELKKNTKAQSHDHVRTALVETFAIVVIGLSLGVTSYFGTTTNSFVASGDDSRHLENIALAWYSLLREEERMVRKTETANELVQDTEAQGIVILPFSPSSSENSVQEIKDSFSDPVLVSIDPDDSQMGIVTPVFKNASDEKYRFLMVPVMTETQ